MKAKILCAVVLGLGLTGCVGGGGVDLNVNGGTISGGTLHFIDNGNGPVDLSASNVNEISGISLYDFQGNAKLSMDMRGRVGNTQFMLGMPSSDIEKNLASGIHVDASVTGQNTALDVKASRTDHVHDEYDSTQSCTTEDTVTQCVGQGSQQVCKTVTIVHHGSQNVHVVRDGDVFHYDVVLTQAAASAKLDASYDDISSHSYPTSACVTND